MKRWAFLFGGAALLAIAAVLAAHAGLAVHVAGELPPIYSPNVVGL
ncbi:MAG: hypothetical protein IRZ26_04835 [Clostridia bacterium]|nr:hypothetical protein [Clostridia bacterium]